MKNTIIFFLLFSAFHAVGQNAKISLNPFKKATLTMRDGSIREGYARFNLSSNFVFKADEDAEKETYDEQKVSRITFFSDEGEETIYEYKIVEGRSKGTVALLELIEERRINLYQSKSTNIMPPPAMGTGMGAGFAVQQTLYYISRKGEDVVTNFRNRSTRSRKFRKVAKELFGDCQELMSGLENKEFRRVGIEEVVKFYNEECMEVGI